MVTVRDWLIDFAEMYSVQHIDDLQGVVVAPVTNEIYLVKNTDVKK